MGNGPLTGYKILDLTQFEAGTVCTETLAWLGAEVWKVERPVVGEQARFIYEDPGKDGYGFIILNMNKKSITCNMKTPEGQALIKKLIAKADVMIENMGPGSIERLGLGYDVAKEINPKIIYTQIKGFGTDGPYADYPAYNPVAVAMGGLAAVNGYPDGLPTQCGMDIADSGAGYMAAIAILGAIVQAQREGIGQRIEVTLQDAVICFGRALWEPYYNSGKKQPKRVGNGMALEDVAPCNMYPCYPFGATDYVQIYCSRRRGSSNFADLCKVMGREDLLEDPRFETPTSRYEYREELDAAISEWTAKYDKFTVMDMLCKADVPAGAVLDCNDITNDEYLLKRGTMLEVEHKDRGKVRVPGFAPRMSENHVEYKVSPGLGEHNREIYGGLLGVSDEELEKLKEKKVI